MARPPSADLPMSESIPPLSMKPSTAFTMSGLAPALNGLDLPAARRRALGLFLRHLALGERVAQRSAARQALIARDTRAARFLRSQARHEALHARIFDAAAACLGVEAPVIRDCPYARFDARLEDAAQRGDYTDTVIGTQLVLEALGDALLQRLDAGLNRHRVGLVRLRRLLRAQEASHHAFGVTELARLATTLPVGSALAGRILPYRQLAARMIDAGGPALRAFDLTPDDIVADLDLRLAQDDCA